MFLPFCPRTVCVHGHNYGSVNGQFQQTAGIQGISSPGRVPRILPYWTFLCYSGNVALRV